MLKCEQIMVCSQTMFHTMFMIAGFPDCKLSSAKYSQGESDSQVENESIPLINQLKTLTT